GFQAPVTSRSAIVQGGRPPAGAYDTVAPADTPASTAGTSLTCFSMASASSRRINANTVGAQELWPTAVTPRARRRATHAATAGEAYRPPGAGANAPPPGALTS